MKEAVVGIIGVGRVGSIHLRNLLSDPNVKVKYVCDILADEDSWKSNLPKGDYQIVKDYHSLLSDDEIDAVVISSPTDLHPQMVIDSANAGKGIFCEKPLGFNLDEIKQAHQAVINNKVLFGVGFNRRFDKNFYRIVEHRDAGQIGEPELLRITSRDPEPPSIDYVKRSGGLFMDMMIHDFDMARFITGQEVTEITAKGANLIDAEIEKEGDIDTAIATLKFKDGMLGAIDNSRRSVYGYDQRIELFGSNGMSRANNVTDTTTQCFTRSNVQADKPMFFFLQRYAEAYKDELKEFVDIVLGNVKEENRVLATYEDGVKAIELAKAAKESLETGKTVKLNEMD